MSDVVCAIARGSDVERAGCRSPPTPVVGGFVWAQDEARTAHMVIARATVMKRSDCDMGPALIVWCVHRLSKGRTTRSGENQNTMNLDRSGSFDPIESK
jgi:hypothetical protein